MRNATYITNLIDTLQGAPRGHFQELERRVSMAFTDVEKLNNLPDLDERRTRLHEKQFSERLLQTRDQAKRLEMLNEQRNLRASFAGSVLLTHEVHYDVKNTLDYMAMLLPGDQQEIFGFNDWRHPQRDDFSNPIMANLANLALGHQKYCPDYEATALLLDSVPELEAGAVQQALRSLFDDVFYHDKAVFLGKELRLFFIHLSHQHPDRLKELHEAFVIVPEALDRYERVRDAYHEARAALNEPQFASRLEQAIRSGSQEKERQVEAEHNRARVQFFCATHAGVYYYDRLMEARARLSKALEKVVNGINSDDLNVFIAPKLNQLFRDKVRNNCLVARLVIAKIDNRGAKPELSRLDDKIKTAVRLALNSFEPTRSRIAAAMLDALG